VISISCSSTGIMNVTPSPMASNSIVPSPEGWRGDEAAIDRIQIKLGPLHAGERPFMASATPSCERMRSDFH
jgi:hypothetical protein